MDINLNISENMLRTLSIHQTGSPEAYTGSQDSRKAVIAACNLILAEESRIPRPWQKTAKNIRNREPILRLGNSLLDFAREGKAFLYGAANLSDFVGVTDYPEIDS